ncbi:MAG: discoidin domain-containing protein, partial [Defluviitaleaceae bacterium]|nr:discoidin domain-containing protein [Defluviitaleaceae bacterium]
MRKKFFLFAFFIFFAINANAAPHDDTPFFHEQSNGTTITVRKFGDEFFHWYEDANGNILAWDSDSQNYFHAAIENERVVAGKFLAGEIMGFAAELISFEDLLPIMDKIDRDEFRVSPAVMHGDDVVITGFSAHRREIELVSFLIEFDGTPHPGISLPLAGRATLPWGDARTVEGQRQAAYFDRTAGALSITNFFEDMSGGQGIYKPMQTVGVVGNSALGPQRYTVRTGAWIQHSVFQNQDIDVTIYPSIHEGIIRVRIHMAHPIERWEGDANNTFYRSRAMTSLAVRAVHLNYGVSTSRPNGINFNARNSANQHNVHFSICMARNPGDVGGYQGSFRGDTIGLASNVNIPYGMYNSTHANEGGNNRGIGVAVHELGHVLGLPDFYSYRSHPQFQTSTGVGWFCVMGMGAGQPPAPLSAYSRVLLGYAIPQVINAAQGGIVEVRRLASNDPNSFNVIRVNSSVDSSQFFLLENRQRNVGWDTTRIGTTTATGGIAIYHIDPFAGNSSAPASRRERDFNPLVPCWEGGTTPRQMSGPVDFTPHPVFRVVMANNDNIPSSGGDHFFHAGAANRRNFNTTTTPNSNFHPVIFNTVGGASLNGRRVAQNSRNVVSGVNIEVLDTRAATMRVQIHGASPTPAITLTPSANHVFPQIRGNATPVAHSVSVSNASTVATGALTVALSGTNAANFSLSRTSIPSIASGGTAQTFTVTPREGLAVGTYRATVTVSGTGITSRSFTVEVTVAPEPPRRSFSLSRTGTVVLTENIYSIGVFITNTGNQPTGALSVALSGTDATSFSVSGNSIPSIAVDNLDIFTVRPNNNLPAGTYNATVTVSAESQTITALHAASEGATISTSGTAEWENHNEVRNSATPASSNPGTRNGWGTWNLDRNGSSAARSAFLQYELSALTKINRAEIFWYDDNGGTRIPTATTWAIQSSTDGTTWTNVKLIGATNYENGRALNRFNSFRFEEIEARFIRIYIWGFMPSTTVTSQGTGVLRFHVFNDMPEPQSFDVQLTVTTAQTETVTITFDPRGGTHTGGGELVQQIPRGSDSSAIEWPNVVRPGFVLDS